MAARPHPEKLSMSLDEIIASNPSEHRASRGRGGGRGGSSGGGGGGGGRGRGEHPNTHRTRYTGGETQDFSRRREAPRRRLVQLTYSWETTETLEVFKATFYKTDIVKVYSNGDVALDSGGFRNHGTFTGMNAVLSQMRISLQLQTPNDYKSLWTVTQSQGKWQKPFEDGMVVSAFPLRAWRSIKQSLTSLPDVVDHGDDIQPVLLGKRPLQTMPIMPPMPMFPFNPLAFMQFAAMAPLMQQTQAGRSTKIQRTSQRGRGEGADAGPSDEFNRASQQHTYG